MLQDLRINLLIVRNSLRRQLYTPTAIPLQPIARLAIALPITHRIGLHARNLGRRLILHISLSFLANYLVLRI